MMDPGLAVHYGTTLPLQCVTQHTRAAQPISKPSSRRRRTRDKFRGQANSDRNKWCRITLSNIA
jgi:hypothetical protein